MLMTIVDLKRGLGVLATVGATAPFVGLLGTTMGIVNAFTGMAASGSGGLSAISAGVAEALITTAFGLIVAIPAVWAYNYFQTKIDNLTAEMTYTSKEMIDYLIKSVSGEFGRSRFTREFNTGSARRPDLAVTTPVRGGGRRPVGRRRPAAGPRATEVTMGMSTEGAQRQGRAERDAAVDVMLVLLIIFMVIIPTLTSGSTPSRRRGSTSRSIPRRTATSCSASTARASTT